LGNEEPLGTLDVSFYRDDFTRITPYASCSSTSSRSSLTTYLPRRFAGYRQALRQKHRSIAKPARRWISAIAMIAGGAAPGCSTMPQSAFPSIAKSRR
ncbi:hypothetical protein K3Z80_25630, partial [Pseudomonas aeruginosa]|nr:hypothetical protein [Pseudomonas aeruginosa]